MLFKAKDECMYLDVCYKSLMESVFSNTCLESDGEEKAIQLVESCIEDLY